MWAFFRLYSPPGDGWKIKTFFERTEGTMTLTAKHIECAEVCARLEFSGEQDAKVLAQKCGVSRVTIYNWLKDEAFLAEKARCQAKLRADLSDMALTHRRDRMTILSSIAMDGNEKSNTRLRALRQIADEAAADLAGMIQSHAEQIDLLKRQMAGEIVALPVVQKEG